jgi:penicillin-binding protein 1A
VLGSEYVSLLSLASAYATLANGGRRVEPYAVRYARTERGEMIYRHAASAAEAISGERPIAI